ncbi:probable chitinase 2 isoform X2 [Eriocheir sinensis]|uniref:probable chitinase 2 isoform X2 n=1 Tax=Eriocheir sinensis TaxID=95602 RepID=UPI0021C88BDD|nr:probable chitinase 2 isoform X2 [Eriocheir sinensis]
MNTLPLFVAALASLALTEGVTVCYFGSWAVYRPGHGKFDVENIDPFRCSHLIYSFAGLTDDNKIKVLDPWNDLCDNYGRCAYDRFTGLKEMNPSLVTLLAVGGWNEGSAKYSAMAANPAAREIFVKSAIALLKKHNFDGLDLDWEYPTQRGGAPADKANFVLLLSELKAALHANGMMLSAAVSAGKNTIDAAYDVPGVAQNLDLLNLMTYDFHGAWEPETQHHSALYGQPNDIGANAYLNQDYAVNYWISQGMPANKISQGVPLYGRCWTLSSSLNTGYRAPASQPGAAGPYTNQAGFLGYNEICESIQNNGWTVVNDPVMNEPYVYSIANNNIWCSYDDQNSLQTKAKYAKSRGLAGMMVWSIETDDFKGSCGRKFNLIKTLRETYAGRDIFPPITKDNPTIITNA